MELWDFFIDLIVLGIGLSAIKDGLEWIKQLKNKEHKE